MVVNRRSFGSIALGGYHGRLAAEEVDRASFGG
jgi:hypothetical protein